MSAIDTAKEIARIAVTAGLSSEIIGLLEKKGVLLTEQVAVLEREKFELTAENTNLKKKVKDLEQKLTDLAHRQADSIKFLSISSSSFLSMMNFR